MSPLLWQLYALHSWPASLLSKAKLSHNALQGINSLRRRHGSAFAPADALSGAIRGKFNDGKQTDFHAAWNWAEKLGDHHAVQRTRISETADHFRRRQQ